MFFDNQLKAQQQYKERKLPPEIIINKIITTSLSSSQIDFIRQCFFCFIASSNKQGQCDCSFRGSDIDCADSDLLLPLLKVISPDVLIMPDFSGNGIFDTVGNFLDNKNIGMIFIDFEKGIRLRVNGEVKILQPTSEYLTLWPNAKRIFEITTKRCFFNCNKRIKTSFNKGKYYEYE
ncbi:MAG: pyridoxamine 5'-phosphate oxidase family protein [Saccharospirillaceae bacterium]|nr:pyridoxamine 5'-phosphate oxidase family protein [Pseudomonadales bacterium]NRB80095.1 pyridoxamine 5'-phosphate oxidase family protein [Saccharospirillaceae bacterium]